MKRHGIESMPLVLILNLLFACVGGLEDVDYSNPSYDFSTEFPTSETTFSIEVTLEDKDNSSVTRPEFGSDPESDRVDNDELNHGNTEESEDINTCGTPPVVEHARILGKSSPPYDVGTSLAYTCEFGYSADRATHTSTCIQSSVDSKPAWTHPNILCTPRTCGHPGFVANAERIGSQFTFPNSVTFECEDGYLLSGTSVRYCQVNGRWSASLPSCEKIKCKTPEKPENGEVFFTSLDYGSSLRYKCDQGFLLKNHQTRICSENGTWSGEEPLCSEAKCDFPVAPEYGQVELVGKVPRTNTIAVFSCQNGRILVGSSVSKCLDIGEWTFPTPKCLAPCSVPHVEFGTIGKYEKKWNRERQYKTLNPGTMIQDGEKLFLRCSQNYEPLGENKGEVEVSCEKGEWKKAPDCKPAQCRGDPPPTDNAKTARVNREHKGYVVYHCEKNFKKDKYGNVTCHFGAWRGRTPVCADRRCYVDRMGFPGILGKGQNVYAHRQEFKPSCEGGYEEATPGNTFICENGVWKGKFPPCKAASCSEPPPSIEHGYIKNYKKLHTSFVNYECNNSYALTSSKVQCLFGEWKGNPPICKATSCYFQDLKFKEGMLVPSKSSTENGKELDVHCASGYHKLNILPPFCSRGEWTEERIPPCEENSCSVLEIQNGVLTVRTHTKRFSVFRGTVSEVTYDEVRIGTWMRAGKSLYVTCMSGYTFQGKQLNYVETTCTKGKWKPTPVCLTPGTIYEEPEEIAEAPRISIAEGSIDVTTSTSSTTVVEESTKLVEDCSCPYAGSEYLVAYADNKLLEAGSKVKKNSIVKFHCKHFGYDRLIGEREIMCEQCRSWGVSEYPHCDPPSFGDAIIQFDEKFKILPGGVLTVDQGLDVFLGCFGKGVSRYPIWSYPSHVPANYSSYIHGKTYFGLLDIHNASARHNGEYSCVVDGHEKTSFQLHVIERCKLFEQSDDLTVHYDDGQRVNSSVLFTCRDTKKKLEGSAVLTCLQNGHWSGPPPRCISSACQKLNESENMRIAYSDGLQTGSLATFHCPALHKRVGGSSLECLPNGQWSGNVPTCIPSGCQGLNANENMEIQYSNGLQTGSLATFHCPALHKRDGVSSLECLPNGEWSGNVPTCIPPTCSLEELYEELPETVTAHLKEETDNTLPYGFKIDLICDGNMRLSTPATVQCGIEGKWKIPKTECVPGCPPVQMLPGSQVIIRPEKTFYRFGEYVELSCLPGQALSGELEVLMCLSTGWSASEIPSCEDSTRK